MRNKYGAKKVKFQGKTFDSKIERDRYIFLQQMEKNGEIKNINCQVSFDIIIEGELICRYVADFVYDKPVKKQSVVQAGHEFMANEMVVEDVKGMTRGVVWQHFQLKKKLMKAVHGIDVRVVKSPTDVIG